MTALPAAKRMTVAEFLAWAETQPGRYELVDGQPVAMTPERIEHNDVKLTIAIALRNAIRRAGLDCHAQTDGMTVKISDETAYEPDALVYCGKRLPPGTVVVEAPVIVVEVLSPSTSGVDTGLKLTGYFSLPSVRHYLVIDPVDRLITHHARKGAMIETVILREGEVRLDPPGIAFDLSEAFD